jgi:glutaredoxin
MSLDQVKIPDNVVVDVTGPRDTHTIVLTTLSTCMWCKRGKQWLADQGYAYSYVDIDKLTVEEKNEIKKQLQSTFGVKPRFPFIVIDKMFWNSGYNPDEWEGMLK